MLQAAYPIRPIWVRTVAQPSVLSHYSDAGMNQSGEKITIDHDPPIRVVFAVGFTATTWSRARLHKDHGRGDGENDRKDRTAVPIKFLCALGLLIVIQNCRHQNFDQRKENK